MSDRALIAIAGFIVLGLSPSFVDWQQADAAQRKQIAIYYGVAISLIYIGALRRG